MGTRSEQTEEQIAHRLAVSLGSSSPNEISMVQLRQWAVEYLDEYDAEVARFPALAGQPHWNLWMMDVRSEDAMFAAVVFRPAEIEFLCGTGEADAIRDFAETNFPTEAEQVPAALSQRFAVPAGSLHLSRETAEAWLGRSW